jgi:hypothetical protein
MDLPKTDRDADGRARQEFLLHMYDQLWNNINRHIVASWQSVAAVIASLALLALFAKGTVSMDIAASIIAIAGFWLIANSLDSLEWFNRNQLIICNIEREFLTSEDTKNIHYYFKAHREPGQMLPHFLIQILLGSGIIIVALVFHIESRLKVWIHHPAGGWTGVLAWLPVAISVIALALVLLQRRHEVKSEQKLNESSPGA